MVPDTTRLQVFINYRRSESAGHAGRLYDTLVNEVGEGRVFMDIDAIDLGVEYAQEIDRAVGTCDVLLAIIGRGWLTAADEDGHPRLQDPEDFVRLELESALRRGDIRIIPVLIQGASMPRRSELPESLQRLSQFQAHELSDNRFRYDTNRLVAALQRIAAKKEELEREAAARREAEEAAELEQAAREAERAEARRKAGEEAAREEAARREQERAAREAERTEAKRRADEQAAREGAARREQDRAAREAERTEARRKAEEQAAREEAPRREEERAAQEAERAEARRRAEEQAAREEAARREARRTRTATREPGEDAVSVGGTSPWARAWPVTRRAQLLVIASLGGLLLVGGFALSAALEHSSEARTNSQALSLTLRGQWSRDPTGGRSIEGLQLKDPIALQYDPLSGRGILRAGILANPASGASPLPPAVSKRFQQPPHPQQVEVDGMQALAYKGPAKSQIVGLTKLGVFVIPTTKGWATIGCEGPAHGSAAFAASCREVAGTLELRAGAKAQGLSPDSSYAAHLSAVLAHLAQARDQAVHQLSAKSPVGQASGAAALAKAYRQTGSELGGLTPNLQDQAAHTHLSTSATQLARSYDELAAAARMKKATQYNQARATIARLEPTFDAALADLRQNGYRLKP
jgi:chemotaxis protein histidine kinase CheA